MWDIADEYLKEMAKDADIPLIYLEEWITKQPYGNIYHYTSKAYYETKDEEHAVAGNAPFLVEKDTGNIITFGTALSEEHYMKKVG